MKRKIYLFIFFCFSVVAGKAQIGGEYTYQFLELTNSARIAALGGTQVAIMDSSDLNLPYTNPALLHKDMDHRVLVNYVNYLADVNYGYASYAKTYDGIGNFAVGMHYINYGQFDEATEAGELTGLTFKAAEYALNLIYSNRYKRLNYGINLKPILSSFESYQSFGIAADLGASFASKDGYTNVALVVRNIGTQISTYYDGADRERIPLNIQAGISKRLQHAPLIFSATLQHLNHWDLASNEEEEDFNGETIHQREESFAKQTMRHLVLGAELLPSENFTLRVGYNYQRRQELKFDNKASTVGLSAGFGLKIKRFHFDYAISRFHLAGSSNLFSVAVNLNNNF
ncbi:type IX secretion system protein PorQ [Draconibacterium orientale]|uniref:type IX secretion system protein PorQ n=1 Tax=Draconibacterium orientale TaxID=1168034 RepID=UPI002A0A223D|nr:type IX secretion system protein PorQ [Draconibacterium orientale]